MNATQTDKAADALRRALAAAHAGDFVEARELACEGLGRDKRDNPTIHAFLGMIEARLGDLPSAAEYLRAAHEGRPEDVTIACNLLAVLMDLERDEAALSVATASLARADASGRIARYRAFLAQKLERFESAVEAYEMVLATAPDDFECWNNLGNAQIALENHQTAADALRRAKALDPQAAPTRLNLATALIALGHGDEAETELRRAADDFPDDPRPPYQLYLFHKGQAQPDEALVALAEATARNPDVADMQLKLGIEYGAVRRTEDAERAYRRVLALEPTEAEAYIGLAIQFEHMNREEEFAPLIELAQSHGVDAGALAFIEALELRRQQRFDDALAKIEEIPTSIELVRAVHMRATLLDRLGQTDQAFCAFSRTNALLAESPTDPLDRAKKLRKALENEIELLTPEWRDSWRSLSAMSGPAQADPVFLVGFPRSGTTLLDTILMGHPQTVVMEEQPPLNIVEDQLGGLTALPSLDDMTAAAARARYFEEVQRIQPLAPGQLLIDKSPLFLYRVPLIRRLFPGAKIILALRHPCDVVLSCFMSNFRLNPAMANFLRLDDAAAFYDLCLRHWDTTRELFAPDVHTVTYERLIENTEAEVRALIEWLGLEWNARLLDHTVTAKSRGLITTASYSQVTEPIYRRASGRWLRYRTHLAPVLGTLAPWAEKFGYGDPREAVNAGA